VRFVVRRASIGGDEKPVDDAVRATMASYDCRTCKSFAEFDETLAKAPTSSEGPWESKGAEHTVLRDHNGAPTGIRRRFDVEKWVIDFDTLDDLVSFAREHGGVILENADPPEVMIYDDYIE
jgi:hypothetical protein